MSDSQPEYRPEARTWAMADFEEALGLGDPIFTLAYCKGFDRGYAEALADAQAKTEWLGWLSE
jgi:hypothetical protein